MHNRVQVLNPYNKQYNTIQIHEYLPNCMLIEIPNYRKSLGMVSGNCDFSAFHELTQLVTKHKTMFLTQDVSRELIIEV